MISWWGGYGIGCGLVIIHRCYGFVVASCGICAVNCGSHLVVVI